MSNMLSKIGLFLRTSKIISAKSNTLMIRELSKLVHYKIVTGHGPELYLLYSLYEKDISEWQQFLGKNEMCEMLLQVNTSSDFITLDNKINFYLHCEKAQLPSPRILLSIGAGKEYLNLPNASDFSAFESLFEELGFGYYIFKPTQGSYGDGIHSFSFNQEGFVDLKNEYIFSPAEMFEKFIGSGDCYLIQRTLIPTPQLRKIMPFPACGMVRVVSYLEKNGDVSILYAFVTLPSEGQIVSNFMHGFTGNLLAAIDVKSGKLKKAFRFGSDQLMTSFDFHPDTKERIEGLEISEWDKVLKTAKDAAKTFGSIRFIGWDIAVSDAGVTILEGNPMCDPDGMQLTMQKGIRDELASRLKD